MEAGGFLKTGGGRVEVTGGLASLCAQYVIAGGRVEPHRAVEVDDGAAIILLAHVDLPAAAIRRGAISAEADGLLIILHRTVGIAEVAAHGRPVHVRRGRI